MAEIRAALRHYKALQNLLRDTTVGAWRNEAMPDNTVASRSALQMLVTDLATAAAENGE